MLHTRKCMIALLLALLALSACSNVQVTDYKDAKPALDVETFFDGKLTAHGVVLNRSGRVTRSFNADIKAYWEGGTGTLEEDFVFDDGELQRRVWVLRRTAENRYLATANDVVGDGVLTQSGNSAFLDYILQIPWGDSSIDLSVDDRMYLVSPNVLLNESDLTKFGFTVGRLLLTIVKHE